VKKLRQTVLVMDMVHDQFFLPGQHDEITRVTHIDGSQFAVVTLQSFPGSSFTVEVKDLPEQFRREIAYENRELQS
jgi:hypothetical protein